MLPWFSSIQRQLEQRARQRSLHHALLFSGTEGIGKQVFANSLATSLLCKSLGDQGACGQCQSCELIAAGSHPDFHIIESEKQIGVDSIRNAIQKLSGTAQLGHNKVLIVVAADTMTEAAANALLKTLEEPTSNTYLILLTESLNRLLPTILSRCEKIKLPTPTHSESKTWLATQGYSSVDDEQLSAYGNAPFKVKAALEEGEGLTFSDFSKKMSELNSQQTDALTLANKWQNDAQHVVNWCQQFAHKNYIASQTKASFTQYQACTEAQKHLLHPGVNKTLVLVTVLKMFS